jgi:penicillin-binding protein 2
MGIEGLIQMIQTFQYDKRSGIDLPNEKVSQTPKTWMPWILKHEGKWSDIRTVYASIGQDTVVATPISMLRAIASVGVHGKMYTPHLLKDFKPIGAIGEEGDVTYIPPREGFSFQHPQPTVIPITEDQYNIMLRGMWGVVNNGGTAASIKMPNWEIAGKTGTAQVSSLGSGGAKDHAWFISFAPAYKPELAVVALVENSGFGAANAAPIAKGIYETYVAKHHPELGITPTDAQARAPQAVIPELMH